MVIRYTRKETAKEDGQATRTQAATHQEAPVAVEAGTLFPRPFVASALRSAAMRGVFFRLRSEVPGDISGGRGFVKVVGAAGRVARMGPSEWPAFAKLCGKKSAAPVGEQ